MAGRPAMTEAQALDLLQTCSNVGRWGVDDERGTLNYVTPDVVLAAVRTVTEGRVLSLGHVLDTVASPKNPEPLIHRMHSTDDAEPLGALDDISVSPHGFAVTHLDAIAHVFFEGAAYNGRRAADIVTATGMTFGSIEAIGDGFVTRGIVLDVARARGVPYLAADDGVTVDDLERAEALSGARVERGDAIFVRVGLEARETREGPEDPAIRCGITPECIPWFHQRQIAVYSGDCVEQMPSGFERMVLPLHQVACVVMGLVMLDNTAVEGLADTAAALGRSTFLLACSPLRIPGGTGSPVNPLAVF
jgi:kynurenine formamidase